MTSSKSTKRALITSALAILMCVAMLVGTTFAWFTDTASTGVNKIVSGNLKVDIIGANSENHVDTLKFTKAGAETDAGATEEILWEPGCRYLTEGFRIANKGNLALKWKAQVNMNNIINGKVEGSTIAKDGKSLLDVIDFYVVTKAADGTETAVAIENFTGKLAANDGKSETYYIKGVMQTTAGNDYQDLTLDGITITVIATQDTVENDSFGDQYDKDAQYPITSFADLKAAVEWNGKYNVTENLDPDASLIVKNAVVTLNATGKTIANTRDIYNEGTYDWSMISVRSLGNLTITGGTFAAKANDCFVIDVRDGGYLTIEDGKFIGNVDAIYVEKGTAVIEGGFFDIQQKSSGSTLKEQYKTLLNCQNANYNAGKAKIIVKGGTFVNFDPSNNPEGEGTSFVANGYKVVSEAHGSDTWYTVVAE